jgi:hypothetical protein
MEKVCWTDRVRNGKVVRRVKEERNILHTVKRKEADWVWIDHNLLRNCLLKHVIERMIGGSDGKTRRKTEAAAG